MLLDNLLIGLLMLVTTFGGGYYIGSTHANDKHAASLLAQQQESIKQLNIRSKALSLMSQQLEKAKNERTVEYRTLTQQVDKVVVRPVYRNVCLDADGLRIANTALAGGHAAAARQLDAIVPQPAGDKRR